MWGDGFTDLHVRFFKPLSLRHPERANLCSVHPRAHMLLDSNWWGYAIKNDMIFYLKLCIAVAMFYKHCIS